ncbi:hypothetical protein SAMN05443662_0784 [Sulfurivirga caldicuralii]|uniref:Uncharacterized protein n=1 Tax=Sulfurivirga caldicuralii TaxID=364032 RepID=A0A1N6EUP3_9GAMM|nr:hypothetical protein SAMN05443662_0784 [Sulfurivirga caldicuralii]
MWIHHLGTVMAGVFVVLIVAHLGLHVYMKKRRRKQTEREQ